MNVVSIKYVLHNNLCMVEIQNLMEKEGEMIGHGNNHCTIIESSRKFDWNIWILSYAD
jgi:hypothetical protein